ncbi:MAG: phenylalanine--tRNA ligase subunit beta [Spirochaetota bacterium]
MPKIEVHETTFWKLLGKRLPDSELASILTAAKAEFDGRDDSAGMLKIELNDTNRPDLWSTAGLARQLRVFLGGAAPHYAFFSAASETKDSGRRKVVVDKALREIRPYIVAFAITGKELDDPGLKDIIQSQEKLCWNFGRRRKTIAMGIYRSDIIAYPVKYFAADPEKTRFIPLGLEKELNLKEILKEHPKGQEFGYIMEGFKKFPFLTDSNGEVLSFPPVINSAYVGAARVGDRELFIELTGTDIQSLLLSASITACGLSDLGFTILPVKVEYPYDTPLGREIVMPYYFQEPVTLNIRHANKLLGENLSAAEAARYIEKIGCRAKVEGDSITVMPTPYRNDFLHPVDVIEDIMIGRGMESFVPVMPTDFTVGRLSPATLFGRRVKDIMTGLGYQEMVYSYLGSEKDFIEKMYPGGTGAEAQAKIIRIENPMTESYEYVRPSILPNLLSSESVSGNAVYPHTIFEIGKVAFRDSDDNYGTKTRNYLGFLAADKEAGFNLASSHVSALFFYLPKEYTLTETEDPRFIRGRSALILYKGRQAGILGEVHPAVLENWGIQIPCIVCEIDLDLLMDVTEENLWMLP